MEKMKGRLFLRRHRSKDPLPWDSGRAKRTLRPIQKWTSTHGSIDAKAKKYDQWLEACLANDRRSEGETGFW
jgi:hypothetical protein